ncbi:LacI family DNA-binding transcriptional regulator, partial [Vibrio diabolicus]|uniref:LacI family DNA-binding transcriptional regulator n=1 Tax=Vibrio diabolicus TaxID=50719 RepID=UPI0029407DB8
MQTRHCSYPFCFSFLGLFAKHSLCFIFDHLVLLSKNLLCKQSQKRKTEWIGTMASLHDVARLAGVSKSTVSRVINDEYG